MPPYYKAALFSPFCSDLYSKMIVLLNRFVFWLFIKHYKMPYTSSNRIGSLKKNVWLAVNGKINRPNCADEGSKNTQQAANCYSVSQLLQKQIFHKDRKCYLSYSKEYAEC